MTKAEAKQALREGKKVSHRYFTDDEFIQMVDGQLRDENGYLMGEEFWKWRDESAAFDKDWEIYNPINKHL